MPRTNQPGRDFIYIEPLVSLLCNTELDTVPTNTNIGEVAMDGEEWEVEGESKRKRRHAGARRHHAEADERLDQCDHVRGDGQPGECRH